MATNDRNARAREIIDRAFSRMGSEVKASKTTSNRADAAPMFVTDIDQDHGEHKPTGLRETRLTTIATSYGMFGDSGPWERLGSGDREWWRDTLSDVHAARVEVAALPHEHRQRVEDAIVDEECDLSDWPGIVRRAIEATR
jgi:hypothetical protein